MVTSAIALAVVQVIISISPIEIFLWVKPDNVGVWLVGAKVNVPMFIVLGEPEVINVTSNTAAEPVGAVIA